MQGGRDKNTLGHEILLFRPACGLERAIAGQPVLCMAHPSNDTLQGDESCFPGRSTLALPFRQLILDSALHMSVQPWPGVFFLLFFTLRLVDHLSLLDPYLLDLLFLTSFFLNHTLL